MICNKQNKLFIISGPSIKKLWEMADDKMADDKMAASDDKMTVNDNIVSHVPII